MSPLERYLIVAALLFGIGLAGALTRRNAILVLAGIELMLTAVNLNLIAFGRYGGHAHPAAGQVFVLFVIAVAAAETAVGLALIIALFRHRRTVQLDEADELSG
jgi:NADH-quinone oxidoreductase subunit K